VGRTRPGHTLQAADRMAILAVEAAIHYLDMTIALAAASEPDPALLALARRGAGGLAGSLLPGGWGDTTCALKGTCRLPATAVDRFALGLGGGRLCSSAASWTSRERERRPGDPVCKLLLHPELRYPRR
jgi:hypothetical protein